MMQTSRILYHFLAFTEVRDKSELISTGGTVGKRGVALLCFVCSFVFFHDRCVIDLPEQLNCGMRKCDRDAKPLLDLRSKMFRLMKQFTHLTR
jgi:hypothetical protein